MKRVVFLLLIAVFFSCESNLESNEKVDLNTNFSKSSDKKVSIMHKGKEISVAEAAVAAHLAHGDSLVDDTPDPGPR